MAYVSKETKATIAANVKPILAKYGIKATLSVKNYSGISLNIKSGKIDFIGIYNRMCSSNLIYNRPFTPVSGNLSVSNTAMLERLFDGEALKFMEEITEAMCSADWYNHSDIMTDYFDVAYYIYIEVGKWDKPYIVTE